MTKRLTSLKYRFSASNKLELITPCPKDETIMIGSEACKKCFYCEGRSVKKQIVQCKYKRK